MPISLVIIEKEKNEDTNPQVIIIYEVVTV